MLQELLQAVGFGVPHLGIVFSSGCLSRNGVFWGLFSDTEEPVFQKANARHQLKCQAAIKLESSINWGLAHPCLGQSSHLLPYQE